MKYKVELTIEVLTEQGKEEYHEFIKHMMNEVTNSMNEDIRLRHLSANAIEE